MCSSFNTVANTIPSPENNSIHILFRKKGQGNVHVHESITLKKSVR